MAKVIKRIKTADGNLQIDHTSLANLPVIDTELDINSTNAISNSAVAEHVEDINSALLEIISIAEDLVTPDGDGVKY